MTPVTAEKLLSDLSKQLDIFIRFISIDLTSVILEGVRTKDACGLRNS